MIGYMMKREVIVKKTVNGKVTRRKQQRVRMLIGPSDRFETGVRYSALKDFDHLDNPDFSEMLKTIGTRKEATKNGEDQG